MPNKGDIFIFEWGDSPYRPVPYRRGIAVKYLFIHVAVVLQASMRPW